MATKVKLIADGAVTSAAIGNNPTLSGTEGVTLPAGTTAERPSSPDTGVFRFNTAGVLKGKTAGVHPAAFHHDLPNLFINWLTDEGDLV